MANKIFDRIESEIDVQVHNSIMGMYASDEQLAALSDRDVRPATETELAYARERRCKLY